MHLPGVKIERNAPKRKMKEKANIEEKIK